MGVPEISIGELDALDPTAITLIDVREPEEFVDARVPGARSVPLATIPEHMASFATGERIYVICAIGGRSLQAAEFLAGHGFDTVNVAGGTNAWVDSQRGVDRGPEAP